MMETLSPSVLGHKLLRGMHGEGKRKRKRNGRGDVNNMLTEQDQMKGL